MKQEEELLRKIMELVKETQAEKILWEVECMTSEYNPEEEKSVEKLEGMDWFVDECFVSYHCLHKGKDFLMITYEKIYSSGDKKRSVNLVFLPPLGVRYFDLDRLAGYAVKANQMLVYDIHMLWMTILEKYRSHPQLVHLTISAKN